MENRSTKCCKTREKGETLSWRVVIANTALALLLVLPLNPPKQAWGQDKLQNQAPPNSGPPSSGQQSGAPLQKRVDSLQSQIERLSKDVGSLGQMTKQESDDPLQSPAWLAFVAEMQERLRVMERTLTNLTERVEQMERYGGGAKRSNAAGNAEEDKRSADEQFSAAQTMLRERKVEDAVRVFESFAKSYPNDPRIPEALFYLGESYAVLQHDKAAMKSFLDGYKKDRDGSFASRLLLRLGQTLAKLKKGEQACRVLREFQKRFGDKDADMMELAQSAMTTNSCGG